MPAEISDRDAHQIADLLDDMYWQAEENDQQSADPHTKELADTLREASDLSREEFTAMIYDVSVEEVRASNDTKSGGSE